MKTENYILIQAWMREKLNLKGNDLIVFALINGFCQDGKSIYQGSQSYIANWIGTSRSTVNFILKRLVEKELIIKIDKNINGVKLCDYKINTLLENQTPPLLENRTPPVRKSNTPCTEIEHHNTIYNTIDNTIIYNKEKYKKENFDFRKSVIDLGVEEEIVDDWLKVRKVKKGVNTKTAFKDIKSQIEKSHLSPNECIKIAVKRSWMGFNHKWVENLNEKQGINHNSNLQGEREYEQF